MKRKSELNEQIFKYRQCNRLTVFFCVDFSVFCGHILLNKDVFSGENKKIISTSKREIKVRKKVFARLLGSCIFHTGVCAAETEAQASVVIEASTRQIVYGENCHERLPMASTTKIMTAILALDNGNTTDFVTVSENAQNQEGSSIYLRTNDKVELIDLIYGLMLNSGNDAAAAIAEHIGGSVEKFVSMMNSKAAELGCRDTHFSNPSGLFDKEHYSSAYDMALIMSYALKNEEFRKIISTKEYQIEMNGSTTYLRNHNKLLWQSEDCIGGKTGFTKIAGRCLVSCAERNGITVIAVTLNDRNDWADHKNMYNFAFSKIDKKDIPEKNSILCTGKVRGHRINLLAGDNLAVPYVLGKNNKISCKIFLDEKINKDVFVGMKVGYAEIYSGKYLMGTVPVLSGQEISDRRKPYENQLEYMLKGLLLNAGRY